MKKYHKAILCLVTVIISLFVSTGMARRDDYKAAVETVVLSPGNSAPVAENIEIKTYRNVPISDKMKATDPENENVLFEVTKLPEYGTLKAEKDGSFTYDPGKTKRSKDSFTYTAVDSSGHRSEQAEVTIIIEKRKGDVNYVDMENDVGAFSSIYLSENGIYTGQCVGGSYFFKPDSAVTKAEFLSMCLSAAECGIISDVSTTGLENDEELPEWVKACVSTSVLRGCFTDDEVFEYDENITYEEAAVMLNAVFEITDVISVSSITPYLRNESAQAVNNLYFCGITDETILSNFDNELSMRDAAIMITAASEVINNR